ncbi:MAG: tetratricopeptide repeat protein [Proteobacteria bacterium]|nr:tetratricopeptide repeat protein [Pseudomonadota bacterium]
MRRKIPGGIKLSILVFVSIFLLITDPVAAEIKTFEKEYTYRASDADSKITSRAIALEQIKRLLLEDLGAYLETRTEIINFQLTKEQIITLPAGIVKTDVITERWDGHVYYLKARIMANPDEVIKAIDDLRKNRQKTKELEEVRRKSEELLRENEKLKDELMVVKGEEKREKSGAYQRSTKELNAVEWFEKGRSYQASGYLNDAIDAYNNSIVLDLKFAKAYSGRGTAYAESGNFQQAIRDYDKSIELNPKDALTYYNRGTALDNLGSYQQAVKNFDKAIELNPGLTLAYFNRGIAYHNLGNYQRAVVDYKTAARFGHQQAQDFLRLNRVNW